MCRGKSRSRFSVLFFNTKTVSTAMINPFFPNFTRLRFEQGYGQLNLGLVYLWKLLNDFSLDYLLHQLLTIALYESPELRISVFCPHFYVLTTYSLSNTHLPFRGDCLSHYSTSVNRNHDLCSWNKALNSGLAYTFKDQVCDHVMGYGSMQVDTGNSAESYLLLLRQIQRERKRQRNRETEKQTERA